MREIMTPVQVPARSGVYSAATVRRGKPTAASVKKRMKAAEWEDIGSWDDGNVCPRDWTNHAMMSRTTFP